MKRINEKRLAKKLHNPEAILSDRKFRVTPLPPFLILSLSSNPTYTCACACAVVRVRVVLQGAVQYQVKWPDDKPKWVAEKDLDAPALIQDYKARKAQQRQRAEILPDHDDADHELDGFNFAEADGDEKEKEKENGKESEKENSNDAMVIDEENEKAEKAKEEKDKKKKKKNEAQEKEEGDDENGEDDDVLMVRELTTPKRKPRRVVPESPLDELLNSDDDGEEGKEGKEKEMEEEEVATPKKRKRLSKGKRTTTPTTTTGGKKKKQKEQKKPRKKQSTSEEEEEEVEDVELDEEETKELLKEAAFVIHGDDIARIACEQEPVTDEPEQAEGPKDEAEAAAANTATTATTPSSAGDAPVKAGSGDEGEAPPSCGGEVEVDVVDEETNRNETRMDPKNEDEDDDDDTQMPIERGGEEGHTGAMEVEEAEEGAKAARDDFSLGSDFTPPSPLSLNSAPVSSDDELLKELVEQETDDIMPTSGAARLPSPGLSPPRLTTTREVAMADLDEGEDEDEGEGEGSGETPGLELNMAPWIEKRKRKGEERRRGTKKIKKAMAGRGGDGERDQPCAVLWVPSSPQSRAEDNENEDEEEEEQGTQKAAGDEGDSYIDIWDLLPRPLLGSDPEVNASKQRNRERDDNDEEEEGEGKTTKRREEDGSSGVEDEEAEEAVITAIVPASSSSTGVRASTVDTSAARPPGRALAASPHRQKVPIGEGGQTVVVDIGEEKEEGEQRKAKEEKEKEKRAAQSRSRGATGTKGEGWWYKVSGSFGSVWPTTIPTAAVGPASESMHGRQLIPAPLPPPPRRRPATEWTPRRGVDHDNADADEHLDDTNGGGSGDDDDDEFGRE